MDPVPQSLDTIIRFRRISNHLGTAGQPTADQFSEIRAAGFEAIVNLALPTSDNALPNEGQIVTSLGMIYVHIPVQFEAPTKEDFQMFCGVMEALKDRTVFVHCAANLRVSSFVFLYRVLHRSEPVSHAIQDLKSVWDPNPIWAAFIQQQLQYRGLTLEI